MIRVPKSKIRTGWDIGVSRKGINKTTSHSANDDHARSVAAIPSLLENALLIHTAENRNADERKDVPYVHTFAAPVTIGGRVYVARLVVKETASGQKFYDHDLSNEINPANFVADAHLPKEGAATPPAGLVMSMDELSDVVNSDDHFRPEAKYSASGAIQAFVLDGKAYFVPENISKGTNVKGLMLHEIGVHLKQLGRGDKEFQSILKRLDLMRKNGSPEIKAKLQAAWDRIPKDTKPEHKLEELASYLVEQNPDLSISQKIVAWFRNALRAIGRQLPVADRLKWFKWAEALDVAGIVYMATAAVRRQSKAVNGDVKASKSKSFNESDYRQTVVSWAKEKFGDRVAPNGEMAWKNFVQWFGDSQVTDSEGNPLVVYHGSSSEVTTFKSNGRPRNAPGNMEGFYFAPSKDAASEYGAKVTEAYLKMENPYTGDPRDFYRKANGIPTPGFGMSAEVAAKNKEVTPEKVKQLLIDSGYDGVIKGAESYDAEYIVFTPDKIKSAIGNSGDFSPTNPDIRFSRAAPTSLEDVADRVLANTERKTVIGKIREAIDEHREDWALVAKQGIFDQYASIAELEKKALGQLVDAKESAYKAAAFTKNSNTVLEAAMHFGAVEYKDGSIQLKDDSKGLMEILEPLAKENLMREWELWAGAVRAKRLLREGKERNYTVEDVAFVLSNVYGDKLKMFEAVHKEWQEFNKSTLDFAQEAGLISADQRKTWEKDDYVPFHRVSEFDGTQPKSGRKGGLSGQKSGISQLKGGVEKISIVEAMVKNTAHMIDASMKNVAMQRTLKLAEQQGVVEKLSDAKISEQEAKDRLDAMGIEYDQQTLPSWVRLLEKHDARPGTVTVSNNGKTDRYIVNDPILLRSMTSLGPTGVEGIMKLLRIPKRLLTEMITSDPSFAARNFIRDTMSTWATVHEGKRNPLTGAIRGVVSSFKDSDTQRQMMAQGVGGGGFYDTSPAGARAHLDKLAGNGKTITTVGELWQAYRRLLGTTENANRIAIYEAAMARGASKAEAAYQAMDVLNFSRHGEFKAIRLLIELVPFMNSRLQGLDRLFRGAKEGTTEWHQFNKSFLIKGAMLTGATLALLAANWDEDDYWDLEEWERDTYYHLFVDGEHYRIPKPFEVGAVFSTIPERMFEQFREDANTKLLGSRMLHMFLDTFALDPTPQFVKPALEVSQNKSSFTGRDIVGMGMKYASPEAQYSPYTSRTFIELADAMPDSAPEWMRSPVRLEHLFRGYFGAMGGYVLMGSDFAAREAAGTPDRPSARIQDLPVAGSFIRDGVGTNKQVGRVYEMANAVNQAHSAIKKYKEEGQTEKAKELQLSKAEKLKTRIALNKATRQMSAIGSKIRKVYDNPAMTPDEKREQIDRLVEQRNALAKQIAERYYQLF